MKNSDVFIGSDLRIQYFVEEIFPTLVTKVMTSRKCMQIGFQLVIPLSKCWSFRKLVENCFLGIWNNLLGDFSKKLQKSRFSQCFEVCGHYQGLDYFRFVYTLTHFSLGISLSSLFVRSLILFNTVEKQLLLLSKNISMKL